MAIQLPLVLSCTLVLASTACANASYGYVEYVPNRTPNELPGLYQETFAVQGIVYCRSKHSKLIPLKGAVVRVTCLGTNEKGNEYAPFSYLSQPTDAKGYFFMTPQLSKSKCMGKKFQCKAFLKSSPSLQTCNVPTDANHGISGAPLGFPPRIIAARKKMKLFSVGPFIYN